jgi:hypothetical protein
MTISGVFDRIRELRSCSSDMKFVGRASSPASG